MKKLLMLLLVALPLVAFTSCGDDNGGDDEKPEVTLDMTQLNIPYGSFGTLKCNQKNATWESSNPFVATVDAKGKVTAAHVGETTVTATFEGVKAKAKIVITPTNDNFILPFFSWGASKQEINKLVLDNRQDLTAVPDMDENELAYLTGGLTPGYTYNFVDNRMKAAGLTVTEQQDEDGDLIEFLNQRYHMYGNEDDTLFFCNAENVKDATIIAKYAAKVEGDDLFFSVIWTENSGTKTRATCRPEHSDFDIYMPTVERMLKSIRK